jgi:hypothetical protein
LELADLKETPKGRLPDANELLAKLCWEFVKHPEKAKNGQARRPLGCDGSCRPSESVEFDTISGRKAGALPDANRYKIVVC